MSEGRNARLTDGAHRAVSAAKDTAATTGRRSRAWPLLRVRRPMSLTGWLLWLLVALLFCLIISYAVTVWWYRPVPTDIPPAGPDINTQRTS